MNHEFSNDSPHEATLFNGFLAYLEPTEPEISDAGETLKDRALSGEHLARAQEIWQRHGLEAPLAVNIRWFAVAPVHAEDGSLVSAGEEQTSCIAEYGHTHTRYMITRANGSSFMLDKSVEDSELETGTPEERRTEADRKTEHAAKLTREEISTKMHDLISGLIENGKMGLHEVSSEELAALLELTELLNAPSE